jgi:protein RecA
MITQLVKDLNKAYGKSVLVAGDQIAKVKRVPIHIPAVDFVAGQGGLPINRIIEVIGDPSAGKSTICYKAIAEFQKYDWANHTPRGIKEVTYKKQTLKVKGKAQDEEAEDSEIVVYEVSKVVGVGKPKETPKVLRAALVDYENSYDGVWGEHLGIDNRNLVVLTPEIGSEAVDQTEMLLRNPDICLVVLDSIAAVGSDDEIEKSMEDNQMSANARFWNKAVRKFTAAINSNPNKVVTLIFINRFYEKVGLVFGDPRVHAGGSGWKFGKHLSIDLRAKKLEKRKNPITGKDEVVGRLVEVYAAKNKTAKPYLTAEYYFTLKDDGVYKIGETDVLRQLVDLGLEFGIIEKQGLSFIWGDMKAKGRDQFEMLIEKNGAEADLKKLVYNQLKLG